MHAQADNTIFTNGMNNKKYLSLLVAIIAIGIIIYIVKNNSETAHVTQDDEKSPVAESTTLPSTKQPAPAVSSGSGAPSTPVIKDGVYIVSYTNSGFQPKMLEISRGKTVRFVNNSTKAMRVNTTDTLVSQTLSQPKTVGKGGTYEYTFNDSGTYKYANQNNTADTGAVIVK